MVTRAWLLLLWLFASVPNTCRCICPSLRRALACAADVTLICLSPATYLPPEMPSLESQSDGGLGLTGSAFRVSINGLEREVPAGILRKVDVGRVELGCEKDGVSGVPLLTAAKRSYTFSL